LLSSKHEETEAPLHSGISYDSDKGPPAFNLNNKFLFCSLRLNTHRILLTFPLQHLV